MSLGRTSIDLSLPHFLPWENCCWLSSVLFSSKKLKISIVQDGGCHNIETKKMVHNTNTRKWKYSNQNGISCSNILNIKTCISYQCMHANETNLSSTFVFPCPVRHDNSYDERICNISQRPSSSQTWQVALKVI